MGFATCLMSFMVLSMRIHYTYDVYGAVLFTTIIYFAPAWIRTYYVSKEELSKSALRQEEVFENIKTQFFTTHIP